MRVASKSVKNLLAAKKRVVTIHLGFITDCRDRYTTGDGWTRQEISRLEFLKAFGNRSEEWVQLAYYEQRALKCVVVSHQVWILTGF